MFEQAHGLLIHELGHHIRQYRTNRVESFVGLANILQAHVVKEDLLDDEDGDGLA